MREILFKAKRIDNGEWVEGDLLQDKDLRTAFISGWEYSYSETGIEREPFEYEVIPETICQYTGLTDKNDNKIWENDICIIKDGTLDEEDGRFKCEWDAEAARFVMNGSLLVDFDNVYTTDIEVVGNIFDSPELLETDDLRIRNLEEV